MRTVACFVSLFWLLAALAGGLSIASPAYGQPRRLEYPLKLKLQQQVVVARAPERVVAGVAFDAWSTGRLYDAMVFGVEAGDASRGSRWLAYDVARRKTVALIEDANALVGHEAKPGAAGVRITATSWDDEGRWLGTAAVGSAGGHVIHERRDLGNVEAGWSVIGVKSFDRGAVALACDPTAKRYRFYVAAGDKLVALAVEGGDELRRFIIERDYLCYASPDGKVLALRLDGPSQPAQASNDQFHRFARTTVDQEGLLRGLPAHLVCHPGRGYPYLTTELGKLTKLDQGIFYSAVEGASANDPAKLFAWRPAAGDATQLGALVAVEGESLSRVQRIERLPSGDIAVLAGNDRVTALQIYENPLQNTLAAALYYAMDESLSNESPAPVAVRRIDSFYRFAEHADRGWGCIGFASDGKLYTAPMPHHPSAGCPIFRFSPVTGIELLGDFDKEADNVKPGLMVNMIHTAPVDIGGRVYFLGQDPFYGEYDFPGMTPENTRHVGSPLIRFDIGTGRFESLGVPMAGKSIFGIAADPRGQSLYLGAGYEKMAWHSVRLDANGKPVGELRALELDGRETIGPPHVAPDGKLYFLSFAAENGGKYGAPCEVLEFDPAANRATAVAKFDIEQLHREPLPFAAPPARTSNHCTWLPGQDGREEVFGCIDSVGLAVRFNTRTKELKSVGLFNPEAKSYPLRGYYGTWGVDLPAGKLFWFVRDNANNRPRNTRLLTIDIATGRGARHGLLRDQDGRRFFEVTQAAVAPDGKVYFCGQNFAMPEDETYARRQRASGGMKLDSGLYVLEHWPDEAVGAAPSGVSR